MPPSVFISYSHKDEVWKDRLLDHLGVLEEEGLLQTWNDRNIGAGDEWFEQIRKAMDAAKVALLLVSANSLNSKFIRHKEIPHLLERREKEGMVFIPVIVKSCVWTELPWLARFEALPRDGKALARFRIEYRDDELAKIAKEILGILRDGARPPRVTEPAAIASQPTVILPPTVLPALHQLPSPPADFTGREEDLAALRSRLTQGGTAAIFGFRGMGGVGKTALALKLAEELTSLYSEAQLYLDLKGVDPKPLTASEAMSFVIRSFHPETRPAETEADLAAQYRSALFGKRALLLMDNAANKEQVEPLIPPSGSQLLVTSRFRFTLPGLFARDLDQMSPEDARDLLLAISFRIDKDADEIARLCGRLPLALRLAGSALTERPDLSPADYARRLKEGKEGLDPVDASLTLSYELLGEERRRLWRLLAVFPGTFDAPAAASVWALESDPASEVLSDLVRNSLVEWEEKDKRYRLHDLARSFADRQLSVTEREVLQVRHATHYLELLRTANNLYKQGGDSIGPALQLFDSERTNIETGFAWASSSFGRDEAAAKICAAYPDAGTNFLQLRQRPQERIRWREYALTAARQLKNRGSEGRHLGNLGIAYADLDETRRAIEFYEQALTIACEIGDRHRECQVLGNLGNAYADLGEARRAIEYYEQVFVIARETGDRRSKANALGSLGLTYADLGETRRAIEFFEQALTIARETGDRRGEGQVLGNLGNVYADLGETRRAIECHEQALAIDREIGDRRGEGQDLGNLGVAYADLGETRRAIEYYEQALAIDREIGDRRGEGQDLGNLGVAYKNLGETRRSIEYYDQHLAIAREIGDRRGEGNALRNLGVAYKNLGETRRAIELHEQALAIDREIGDRRGEGQALGNLGLAYADLGETRRAIELYEQRLALARDIGDHRGESNTLGNLGLAYADLGETRRAIEYYDQQLATREIGDRRGEGIALGNLGIAYATLGETRRAIEYYDQQLAITREIGDRLGEASASWNLGISFEKEGDLAHAADLMRVRVDYLRELGHPDAEEAAARVATLRARIAEQGS